jgi:hypothetical protein
LVQDVASRARPTELRVFYTKNQSIHGVDHAGSHARTHARSSCCCCCTISMRIPVHGCICTTAYIYRFMVAFPQTKFHIQKCNTCRSIEMPSRGICYLTMVQHTSCTCVPCRSGAPGRPACTAVKLPQLTDSYRFIYKISESPEFRSGHDVDVPKSAKMS